GPHAYSCVFWSIVASCLNMNSRLKAIDSRSSETSVPGCWNIAGSQQRRSRCTNPFWRNCSTLSEKLRLNITPEPCAISCLVEVPVTVPLTHNSLAQPFEVSCDFWEQQDNLHPVWNMRYRHTSGHSNHRSRNISLTTIFVRLSQ